jgi:hypothetical protein
MFTTRTQKTVHPLRRTYRSAHLLPCAHNLLQHSSLRRSLLASRPVNNQNNSAAAAARAHAHGAPHPPSRVAVPPRNTAASRIAASRSAYATAAARIAAATAPGSLAGVRFTTSAVPISRAPYCPPNYRPPPPRENEQHIRLPRVLPTPVLTEVNRDPIDESYPELKRVPTEYIRKGLALKGSLYVAPKKSTISHSLIFLFAE